MPSLFDPIRLGAIDASNRALMAPLTRGRATREGVPTSIMAEYYAQRAGAGLIISEATGISREGLGWPYAPGLWTGAQAEGWKAVTGAVHAAGGRIVAQLWHMGRLVHPGVSGLQAVSASAIAAPGQAHTYEGKQDYVTPRAMTHDDIARVLDDYRRAARTAIDAGFDGVQLHAANGYLIDQFLRDGVNQRDDAYGGPIGNRLRLLREAAEALIGEVGAGRTSVRLSPNDGLADSDPDALFTAAAATLGGLGIAFLEMRASRATSTFRAAERDLVPAMRAAFSGPLVLNSDYGFDDGQAALDEGRADAIAFGRPFLANPDLVDRLRRGADLNPADIATYYSQGPAGYTDYPALEAISPVSP